MTRTKTGCERDGTVVAKNQEVKGSGQGVKDSNETSTVFEVDNTDKRKAVRRRM